MKVVVTAIIREDGKFLLGKRSSSEDGSPGYWSPIGGLAEAGESQEQALVRECREEIGVEVCPIGLVATFSRPQKDAEYFWWKVEIVKGKPNLVSSEHTEIGWFDLKELTNLTPIYPDTVSLLSLAE